MKSYQESLKEAVEMIVECGLSIQEMNGIIYAISIVYDKTIGTVRRDMIDVESDMIAERN